MNVKNVAVILNNTNIILHTGSHLVCAKFIQEYSWLYGRSNMALCTHNNGVLGNKLRPFLWENKNGSNG